MSYTIVEPNGKIAWSVSCAWAVTDEYVGLRRIDDMLCERPNEYYIDANDQLIPIPPPPSSDDYWVFDYDTKTWIDTRELPQAKINKIDEFKQLSVTRQFIYNGNTFERDEAFIAMTLYISIHNSFPPSYNGNWLDTFNNIVSIPNKQQWKNMFDSYMSDVDAKITKLMSKVTQINSCTTLAQLDSIVW